MKKLVFDVSIANGIISSEQNNFTQKSQIYIPVLKKAKSIEGTLNRIGNALKKYEEFLI